MSSIELSITFNISQLRGDSEVSNTLNAADIQVVRPEANAMQAWPWGDKNKGSADFELAAWGKDHGLDDND